jgi:hypothetical protein
MCKPDCTRLWGFSSVQKCLAALWCTAYGAPCDRNKDDLRMVESPCFETMGRFCWAIVAVFGKDYLWAPIEQDTARIMTQNAARGFPRILGSINCMHWGWNNYPFAWQGLYKGHTRKCNVILEAVADQDFWIWHAFFGIAETQNDINVLQRCVCQTGEGTSSYDELWDQCQHFNKGTTSPMVSIYNCLYLWRPFLS